MKTISSHLKVHLTPKNFFRSIESTRYSKHLSAKIFEFAWILDFVCPLKVALKVLHDRVLGSLGRRLLMTSTQEPNTMAPQSALCICSRNGKQNESFQYILGLKRPNFVEESFLFHHWSQSWFDSKDSKINFDRARSTTVRSLLGALRALYNISSDDGEDLFADELLVY